MIVTDVVTLVNIALDSFQSLRRSGNIALNLGVGDDAPTLIARASGHATSASAKLNVAASATLGNVSHNRIL
jgi:hypothetical protein